MRERGLKYLEGLDRYIKEQVAPCAGAWIEILEKSRKMPKLKVAPCAGAWIEMVLYGNTKEGATSLPVRERGLKWTPP